MDTHPALHDEPIYLDYNATTPVDPAVVTAMQPYLDTWFGNPSSAPTATPPPPRKHWLPPEARWPR